MLDILGLLVLNQYSLLILVDFIRGFYSWGMPSSWLGSILLEYVQEWLFFLIVPLATMLWWRHRAKRHLDTLEEL